jgi:predicted DNA-binding transcriptional regulator AlpA
MCGDERALTERGAAERLGLAVATLRAWRTKGKGPRFVRFGRAVRYLPCDLEEFIRASAVDIKAVSLSHVMLDSVGSVTS